MTLIEQLHELGLGKNEAAVYVALFELGRAKAGEIIARIGLHRNLVYTALDELAGQKLAAKFIKRGITIWEANNPKALLEKAEARRETAKQVARALKAKQAAAPYEIKVFEGHAGVLEARQVILELKPGDIGYVFGGSELMYADKLSAEWKPWREERAKRGVNVKFLCDKTVPDGYLERKNKQPRTAARRLPLDVPLPAMFEVYGDTLNIAVPGKEPITFSIKSPEAAEAMKKFFDYFWGQ